MQSKLFAMDTNVGESITRIKNMTKLSQLNGSWSGVISLRLDLGKYEMKTYVIIHIMCNPRRGVNRCAEDTLIEDCNESDNKLCLLDEHHTETCGRMDKNVSDWSDALVYLNFGAEFDLGKPINMHEKKSTGDFVGPYSVVFAQSPNSTLTSDIYSMKYVQSPSDPYLRMNQECDLFPSENDFQNYFGSEGVKFTTAHQTGASLDNIYSPYLNTCENGDVQSVLPLITFEFHVDRDGNEILELSLDYKLLVFPKPSDAAYDIMPKLKKKGFPISGPYCYGGDPNRGWTVDMTYDSKDQALLTLVKGCLEGKYIFI